MAPLPAPAELRARQVEFFLRRVTSEQAEEDFVADAAAAHATLLARPLGEIVETERLVAAVEAALAAEHFEKAVRPLSRAVHASVVAAMREDKTKVGDLVPEKTRGKLERLLQRPNLVDEELVRRLIEQDAMEETLRDVLYDALVEFNEKVNPFVADWGLPGILKRLGPFGLGPVSKSIENVRAELEKRMEPEMRKFLQGFSRRALHKMTDLTVQKMEDPKFGVVQKSVLAWLYEREVRELVRNADDETSGLAHDIVLDLTEHSMLLEDAKRKRRAAVEELVKLHATEPVGEVLERYGVTVTPDVRPLARALWPAVKSVLESAPVRARVEALVGEFWDEVEAS